jgi:hypothetical protein
MSALGGSLVVQIDELLARGGVSKGAVTLHSNFFQFKDTEERVALGAAWLAAIRRLAPDGSLYREIADAVGPYALEEEHLQRLAYVLIQLRSDLKHGYLREVSELVHADVFDDFLDMGLELLSRGYKDAAAVISGSVMEEHLRKLATKVGVAILTPEGAPRKADTINADLVKAAAYNKIEQKNVTAWLGLRNSAAHGHYDDYDHTQVSHLIDGVRSFVARHPA